MWTHLKLLLFEAARIQWLFDNSVYPIVYPLPRRERMVEDHHSVVQQASRWAEVLDVAPADRQTV
jgi:hypothetical protein